MSEVRMVASLAAALACLPIAVAVGQDASMDVPTPESPEATLESGRRWSEPRIYTSSRTAAWDNPASEWLVRQPEGSPHLGIQLETGVVVFNSTTDFGTVSPSAAVGTYVFLDVMLDTDETFRVGVFGDFVQLGAAVDIRDVPPIRRLTGGGAVGARALFGIDLIEHLIFRAGIESGFVFPDGEFGGSVLGRFELAWRLLDERNLEIGVAAFGGLRYGANQYDCFVVRCVGGVPPSPNSRGGSLVVPGLTASATWVFP